MDGFMSRKRLTKLGFASLGDNVKIDKTARFYGANRISIGSNTRIDAFAVISAGKEGIWIGNHVHIGVYVFLSGAARIEVQDFCNLSGKVSVYSSNDDYHGEGLIGPMVPDHLRRVENAPVIIGRHTVIGSGSVVLPGVTIGEGAGIGALSLVKTDVPPFLIFAGTPAEQIGTRKRDFLRLEQFVKDEKAD